MLKLCMVRFPTGFLSGHVKRSKTKVITLANLCPPLGDLGGKNGAPSEIGALMTENE